MSAPPQNDGNNPEDNDETDHDVGYPSFSRQDSSHNSEGSFLSRLSEKISTTSSTDSSFPRRLARGVADMRLFKLARKRSKDRNQQIAAALALEREEELTPTLNNFAFANERPETPRTPLKDIGDFFRNWHKASMSTDRPAEPVKPASTGIPQMDRGSKRFVLDKTKLVSKRTMSSFSPTDADAAVPRMTITSFKRHSWALSADSNQSVEQPDTSTRAIVSYPMTSQPRRNTKQDFTHVSPLSSSASMEPPMLKRPKRPAILKMTTEPFGSWFNKKGLSEPPTPAMELKNPFAAIPKRSRKDVRTEETDSAPIKLSSSTMISGASQPLASPREEDEMVLRFTPTPLSSSASVQSLHFSHNHQISPSLSRQTKYQDGESHDSSEAPVDTTSSLKNLHAMRKHRGRFRGYFGESLTPDGSEGGGSVLPDLVGRSIGKGSTSHGSVESVDGRDIETGGAVSPGTGAGLGRMHPGYLNLSPAAALMKSQDTEDDSAPQGYEELIQSPREIPEHLSSSPLCPRHPKHPSKGTGYCPYHKMVWGVGR
jgi:hypothetical protein